MHGSGLTDNGGISTGKGEIMEVNSVLFGLSVIWGVLLGLSYFGGLWITLKYITRVSRPKSWLGISYVIRISIILVGFWGMVKIDPQAFTITFLTFFITRVVLTRTLGGESRGKFHAHQS